MPMRITLLADPDEVLWVEMLNALARHNARQYVAHPELPALYSPEAAIEYRRDEQETWCQAQQELHGGASCEEPIGELWCDVLTVYALGYEDCDALAAARTGELLARGTAALSPRDRAYVRGAPQRRVHAEVVLRTRNPKGRRGGLYHCIVRYRLLLSRGWSRWHYDDPSARLGMQTSAPDATLSVA